MHGNKWGDGEKIKGEAHGKHLLRGGSLEISLSKRAGEAAVLLAGDHQSCNDKEERRGELVIRFQPDLRNRQSKDLDHNFVAEVPL